MLLRGTSKAIRMVSSSEDAIIEIVPKIKIADTDQSLALAIHSASRAEGP
jgi:hypothetical protein